MTPPSNHSQKFQKSGRILTTPTAALLKQPSMSGMIGKIIWCIVILGFFWSGGNDIFDAWRHTGPGYIQEEDPDRQVLVTEATYKQDNYISGGGMIVFGALLTWAVLRKELPGT